MKTESELICSVQSGDKDAFSEIIKLFEPLLRSAVSGFLNGELFSPSDSDDLFQEATIALYNAAMSYDLKQTEVTFGLYAKICLNNSLNSALRKRQRQRAADIATSKTQSDSEEFRFDETSGDAELLMRRIDGILSPFEKKVFRLYIHSYSHKFIADKLHKPEKSIDNAIYRIRMKLTKKLL